MKKGSAMEGYIREDGTIRPIEHYDDTELRDNISNLDRRVKYIEDHGAHEDDPSKADKVVGATAGNLASLDENGNLRDSGKNASDFAAADHTHYSITGSGENGMAGIAVSDTNAEIGGAILLSVKKGALPKSTFIHYGNFENLKRALADPSTSPEDGTTGEGKLITSRAVYEALLNKMVLENIGDEAEDFEDSNVIDTILSESIHNIFYSPDSDNDPNACHILLVRNFVVSKTNPATHTTRTDYVVEQTLISNDGIKRRSCNFTTAEHTTKAEGEDWSDWESLTPEVSDTVTEDDENPVSGGAVHTALAGKADNSALANKADKLMAVSIANTDGTWKINSVGTDSDLFATTGIKKADVSVLKISGSLQTNDLATAEDYAVGRVDVSKSGTTAIAEIRINGVIFTREGSVEIDNTITWGDGLSLSANSIYGSQS